MCKPKKSAEELIDMLKNKKGVTFEIISEQNAINYLKEKNNYLRTASYRKNYEKHTTGNNKGKYIHLDFAYLVELSTIDMRLRNILLQMCIDFEHSLKISLVTSVETNTSEDGYNIVDLFLRVHPEVLLNIEDKVDSTFTGALIKKYFKVCTVFIEDHIEKINKMQTKILKYDCPIWVLVEIISFGDFTKLITFYNKTYPNAAINIPKINIMNSIRSLRNACAHNNCLLNNLKPSDTHPPIDISQFIAGIKTIGKEERVKKLSCRPLFEIVCLLYAYNKTSVCQEVKLHRLNDLGNLVNDRIKRHSEYFDANALIKTSFEFLKKTIDNFN